ncbi:uncharacterized protein K02A2.6-like [Tigriopus californicus]|uniref:uncharacterized protein K02A2.6-like n=1 Tax=Tigriopus californicus TaxID=6832 RepID=UPI0027D9D450|nr:uncharacterized protein K02A2.6-like [Tigriopus californicus]
MPFTVITNHKLLLGIFKRSNLSSMDNPLPQRILIKLFGSTEMWLAAIQIYFTLSSNSALDTLSKNATDDINYQAVVSTLLSGQSPKSLPQSHTSKFLSKQWGDLSFVKDTGLLILRGHRIVFPAKSRLDVLSSLLTSHPGIRGTCALARSIYFWPRMYNNIEQVVSSGSTCQLRLSSQQHEPLVHSTSSRPFEAISVDIFESTSAHTHYLIMAHRFLGWLCIARLSWMDTKTVTDILRDWFVDYVIPQFICYDGGPQFRSDFQDFCRDIHITHQLSSTYHPASNGHAESTVKSMKMLLQKHTDCIIGGIPFKPQSGCSAFVGLKHLLPIGSELMGLKATQSEKIHYFF